MKRIIIDIPDGLKLSELSYKDGVITKVFEEDTKVYKPLKNEIVKVKKRNKIIGIAIINDYNDNSFRIFVTEKFVYTESRFTNSFMFEKADINDITEFFNGLKSAGFSYDPISMKLIKL